jgi:hypothetical protein
MPLIAPKPVTKPQTATATTSVKPGATIRPRPEKPDPIAQFLSFIQGLFNKKSLGYKTNQWDGLSQKYKTDQWDGTISELERRM